jgi:hypothetical protein
MPRGSPKFSDLRLGSRPAGRGRKRKGPRNRWGRPVADPGIGYWDVVLRTSRALPNLSVPSNHSVPRTIRLTRPLGEPSIRRWTLARAPRLRYPSRRTESVLQVTAIRSRSHAATGTSTVCTASRYPRAPSRSRSVSSEKVPDGAACRLTAWDVRQVKGQRRHRQYEFTI